MEINYAQEIESLTKKLVSIKSVCGKKESENKIATFIYNYFSKLSYFKKHPDYIKTYDCGNDRLSAISYIKGKGNETIVLMGHIDTVDVLDYGKIQNLAFNPDKLIDALKKEFILDKEVLKDIDTNDYLFGRGALDMKAGVAAYMEIMKYFSNHIDELNGNLVFICECDEEGDSSGILKSLDILKEIKEKENFKYLALINGDYANVKGSDRYIYHGTVGKLLPCFMVVGKESHVGNPFNAFDPNLLLSLINKNMTLNMELCDVDEAQSTVPPISLKQNDNKDSYTVQTALSAISYFNYLTYTSSPEDVMKKCLKIGKASFQEAIDLMNDNYQKYCLLNKQKYHKLPYKVNVYTYEKWNELLNRNPNYSKQISKYGKKLLKENPNIDMRDYSYKVLLKSYEYYEDKKPVLIIFFGSMYYSSIKTDNPRILNALDSAIKKVQKESTYNIKLKAYYPFISDMSFLSTPFNRKQIEPLFTNTVYPINYPYEKIHNLNIPVINIGTYGKDGHTFVERLEKTYSFNEMPKLVYETIKAFFVK